MSSLPNPLGQPWRKSKSYFSASPVRSTTTRSSIRFDSTISLTIILLVLMLGAGCVSAIWSFSIGHEALKGIRQPDLRPTSDLATRQSSRARRKGAAILNEGEILASVKARMSGKAQPDKTTAATAKAEPAKATEVKADASAQANATQAVAEQKLPIASNDRGIVFTVRSAKSQGGSLALEVSLKNEGTQSVRFLYSFLNVTDENGRAISASTEGLPGELPANGEEYSGTVSIPVSLLTDANSLSLALTDYPNQQLQLKMSGIPIVK